MHELLLGGAEVAAARGIAVVAQVHVLSPEAFEEAILRPAVVGVGDAGTVLVAAVAPQPEGGGAKEDQRDQQQQQLPGEHHSPSSSSRLERRGSLPVSVSFSTVRAAS